MSLKWAEKNILKERYALKNYFVKEMSRQVVKKKSAALRCEANFFLKF